MSNQTSTKTRSTSQSEPNRNMQAVNSDEPRLADVAGDVMESFRVYAKKRPEVVAMWCLGVGFVLGWKLKPW